LHNLSLVPISDITGFTDPSGDGVVFGIDAVHPATLSATSFAFGNIPVPGSSQQTLSVTNTSGGPFTVDSGTSNSAFTASPQTLTLGPGDSGQITIAFTATATGAQSGSLTLNFDRENYTPVTSRVSLSGSGVPAVAESHLGADVAVASSGDDELSDVTSVEAAGGARVVFEVFATDFADALGAQLVFVLSDMSAIDSGVIRARTSEDLFPLSIGASVAGDTIRVALTPDPVGSTSSHSGPKEKVGGLRLTMASDYTELRVRLLRIRLGDEFVESDIEFVVTNPSPPEPVGVAVDLNPSTGNQGQHLVTVNPGAVVPLQVFAAGITDVTAYEIRASFDPTAIDASQTVFAPALPFVVSAPTNDGGSTEPDPVAGSATNSRLAGDVAQASSGDDIYDEVTVVEAAGGERVVFEVFATDFADALGAQLTFVVSDMRAIDTSNIRARTSEDLFPLSIGASTVGDTIRVALTPDPVGSTSSHTGDKEKIGGLRLTTAENYSEFRVRLVQVRLGDEFVDANFDFVVRNPAPSTVPTGPSVEVVSEGSIIARATSAEPVSGGQLLARLGFKMRSSFRATPITIDRVSVTSAGQSVTLAENLQVAIRPSISDVPVPTKPPAPTTVTDTRAIIEGEFNRPGIVTVLYGTDPANLDQSVASISEITRYRLLVEGLTGRTRYFFQVQSSGTNGESSLVPDRPASFITRDLDTNPPRIVKGPATLGLTNNGVDIVFETNEAARVNIEVWTNENAAQVAVVEGDEFRLVHLIQVRNLSPATDYFFFFTKLEDVNGNSFGPRVEHPFTTRSVADTRPPRILGRPTFNGGVISWVTDEESDTGVFYSSDRTLIDALSSGPGPQGAAPKQTVELPDSVVVDEAVRNHRAALVNLPADATLYYTTRSTDATGNAGFSQTFSFITRSTTDTTPPQLVRAGIIARVSDSEAVIRWVTNKPSTSVAQYDTLVAVFDDTTGTVGIAQSATDLVRAHELILTELTAAKEYFVKISSADINGVTPDTDDGFYENGLRFVTRPGADTKAPRMIGLPVIQGITDNSAIVRWGADELHTAVVSWGAVGGELTETSQDIEFGRRKSITISGLTAGTEYQVQVQITDPAGNASPAVANDQMVFTTRSDADAAPPEIVKGPVVRNRRPTEATIEWFTSEVADSRVNWAERTTWRESNEYTDSYEEAEAGFFHSVTLTGLTPGTEYHFSVGSADQSGNLVTTNATGTIIGLSRDHLFRTPSVELAGGPKIIQGPVVEFSDTRAKVKWRTNHPATSKVIIGVRPGSDEAAVEGTPVFGELSQIVVETNELVSIHNVDLADLDAGLPYFYQAVSTNDNGEASSFDPTLAPKFAPPGGFGSFTTDTDPDTQFPVITSGPTVIASTSSSLTIEWSTDESANSAVTFGTDEAALDSEEISGETLTSHRAVLTKLAAGTSYAYKVASTDVSGNGATESTSAFGTTDAAVDVTAPVITLINSSATPSEPIYKTDRSATVFWNTNEISDAIITYGTDESALDFDLTEPEFDLEHSLTLTNLDPSTTYFYRVASLDQSNNGPSQSDILSFTTEAGQDNVIPVIDAASIKTIVADNSATISWSTDEISDSAIQFGPSGGSLDFVTGDAVDVMNHSVTLTNLSTSTTYAYVLESTDPSDNLAESAQLEFTTVAQGAVVAPSAPATVTPVAGNGAVNLNWDGSASDNVVGYIVQRALEGGSFSSIATLEDVTEYVDRTVSNGTAYTYQVAALGPQQLAGSFSTASAAITPGEDQGHTAPSLFVVQGLLTEPTIAVVNSQSASGDPLTYTFHLSSSASFTDAITLASGITQGALLHADDPQNVTAWNVDRTLTDGVTYHYRVSASDGVFDSPFLTGSFTVDASVTNPFKGDLNADFKVDFADFLEFVNSFQSVVGDSKYVEAADFVADGSIDFQDFLELVGLLGQSFLRGPGEAAAAGKVITPKVLAYGVDGSSQLGLSRQAGGSAQGQTVVVRVDAANVSDLKAYGVSIAYDTDALSFISAEGAGGTLFTEGGRESELFAVIEHNTDKGELMLASAVTEGGTAEGNGALAYLTFQVLTDHPAGDLLGIEEGIFLDGKFNAANVQDLGGRFSLVPETFVLEPNYPNPFNPETTINYSVPNAGKVAVRIYNVLGQQILTLAEGDHTPGFYSIRWDGKDRIGHQVASGIYLYRMEAAGFAQVQKMLLLK